MLVRYKVAGCLFAVAAATLATAASVPGDMGGPSSLTDAVVTYNRPPPTFGAPSRETWIRYGQRIRINSQSEYDKGVVLTNQTFTQPGQQVSFQLSRYRDGSLASLALMNDPLAAPPRMELRQFTGELETHVGERCRVWRVAHPMKDHSDFVQSGCITDGGVELWKRQANVDAIFAAKVSYREVSPEDVRVPIEALDLASWGVPAGLADHTRDYEVILRAEGEGQGQDQHQVSRRSGPWIYTRTESSQRERRSGQWVGLHISNAEAGLDLHYSEGLNEARSLSITRYSLDRTSIAFADPRERVAKRPNETIIGEECQWWDMEPGMSDAGRAECITPDGISLKIENYSRARRSTIVAIGLRRSPQPLSAVLPDESMVSPAAWGF